ncbi:MAG: neuraminidase-like domain-containing protein [Frankiaceae bacterium]
MNKDQLLALARARGVAPQRLADEHPEAFSAAGDRAVAQAKQQLELSLAEAAPEVRDAIDRLNVPIQPDTDVKAALRDAIAAAGLPADVRTQALITVDNAALPGKPIDAMAGLAGQPLVQPELDRAVVTSVVTAAGLSDAVLTKVLTRAPALDGLTDAALDQLVQAGEIEPGQAEGLGLTATLYQLTDGDATLAKALRDVQVPGDKGDKGGKGDKVAAVRDLAGLDASGWRDVLVRTGAQPADGLTVEGYAATLADRVARLFPTDAFLGRLPRPTDALADALHRLAPVLERSGTLSSPDPDVVDAGEPAGDEADALRADHREVAGLVGSYPGLGLAQIVDDPKLPPADKVARIGERIALLDQVRTLNPDVELLALDLTDDSADLAALRFDGVAGDDRTAVVGTLRAQQRALALADDVSTAHLLMSGGYGSGVELARSDPATIARRTGLPDYLVSELHDEALGTMTDVIAMFGGVVDAVHGGFDRLGVANLLPPVQDYLRRLPGYADLFGSQAFCACEHCESILSPAAYFVDLMLFVDERITQPVFASRPADVLSLKVRRPDLWTVPLTCDNTEGTIATLEIVDEILENYLAKARGYAGSLDDRAAVRHSVYPFLAGSVQSYDQPFVLPLARLGAYLGHAGLDRAAIARVLGLPAHVVAAAALGVSEQGRRLIVTPNEDHAFLLAVNGIGLPFGAGGTVSPFDAQQLLPALSVTRDELGQLLATRWVAGSGPQVRITPEKTDATSVQNDIERVHGLTAPALDRLHRFTRLWRHLPCSVAEVDLLLTHTGATTLTDDELDRVVALSALAGRLGTSIEEACALTGTVPLQPVEAEGRSMFDRLFNPDPFVSADGTYPKDATTFVHPALRDAGAPATTDQTVHRLRAALGIDDEQLLQLLRALAPALGSDLAAADESARGVTLTVVHLSELYRHARLAQLLDLTVPDLFRMLALAPGVADGHVSDDAGLVALLGFRDWFAASGYSLDDLAVIRHRPPVDQSQYPDPAAVVTALLDEVAADRALTFADTVLAFLPGMTEELSRRLVAANPARLVALPDDAGYRLSDDFSLDDPLTVPPGVPLAEPLARAALAAYHPSQVLPNRLAGKLGIGADRVAALLDLLGADLSAPATAAALHGTGPAGPLVALVRDLVPLRVALSADAWDADAIAFVTGHLAMLGIADVRDLSIETVRGLAQYVALVTAPTARTGAPSPTAGPDVQAVLDAHAAATGFTTADAATLGRALDAEPGLVRTVAAAIRLPGDALLALRMVADGVSLARRLGVDGAALALAVSDDYAELERAADAVLAALRAAIPEREWPQRLDPLEDTIREHRRDALADHLLHSTFTQFTTRADLYQHFLIDVELMGCARTSRVVAAISSVQLYVHRVLMNLEQDRRAADDPQHVHVPPTSVPADEWEWRKAYRVWEANRKVFLWPENYLEPTLRDDKTPLFEELESALLQQSIDEQHVLDAYANYLAGFEELSHLRIAGSFHEKDASCKRDVLHLLGVTSNDPPTYYYRAIENAQYGLSEPGRGTVWAPWRKIDVQIGARVAAPAVESGRLHLLWLEYATKSKNRVVSSESKFVGYDHVTALKLTTLRLDGRWTAPQRISLRNVYPYVGDGIIPDPINDTTLVPRYDVMPHPEPREGYGLNGFPWERPYPVIRGEGAIDVTTAGFLGWGYRMDLFTRTLRTVTPGGLAGATIRMPFARATRPTRELRAYMLNWAERYDAASYNVDPERMAHVPGYSASSSDAIEALLLPDPILSFRPGASIEVVNGSLSDCIIDDHGDLLLVQGSVRPAPRYVLRRLGTTLGTRMSRILFTGGVDALLDLATQRSLGEDPLPVTLSANVEGDGAAGRIDWTGALGTYFREVLHHIPALLADHLSSQQSFPAAQQWYHYLFDPTADEAAASSLAFPPDVRARMERDRVWRYLEFRGLDVPRLRQILTDTAAIEAYKKDPFNPHAIARVRISAYQKHIVMKYVDNLLDWADSLFTQFTMESVNEATLLYAMAASILGDRPPQLGDCGEGAATPKSFERIAPLVAKGSEFLIELETWLVSPRLGDKYDKQVIATKYAIDATAIGKARLDVTARRANELVATAFEEGTTQLRRDVAGILAGDAMTKQAAEEAAPMVAREALVAPRAGANLDKSLESGTRATELLGAVQATGLSSTYDWKRASVSSWTDGGAAIGTAVARRNERMKGRRNIGTVSKLGWSLVRQVSPVFCVPVNPELLARWDRVEDRLFKIRHCRDIDGVPRQLALLAPEIDPRLLVRARAAGLSLDDVLSATNGDLPPYRFAYLIDRAKSHAAVVQSFGNALLAALEKKDAEELNRLRLVQQKNLLRLNTQVRQWEIDAATDAIETLERQREAVQFRRDHLLTLVRERLIRAESTQQEARNTATALQVSAGVIDVVAGIIYLVPQLGSPFAMKYGGQELGNSSNAWATVLRDAAGVFDAISASAGLEATFRRRQQGWQHDAEAATKEIAVLDKQLEAARIRFDIAVRAQRLHEVSIEQLDETFDFYAGKFSNLGLYTWLSTTLQRIYRQAYNGAFAMAKLAEQAYRFERGDETSELIGASYWDASHAGLLAGERLQVDLHQMERRFVETNYRGLEIDQPFSLTQVDPAALLRLRETGECELALPEVLFDISYPGHYRRKVKSVRLTIPCVTGPYTNVSATLTLLGSRLRNEPRPEAAVLRSVPLRRSVSIATSTAQQDAGVFELNFRDDRYMPFEGAGAVSSWRLTLPKAFHAFDYRTITDVILHVTYTAEADDLLRERVEQQNAALEGTIRRFLTNESLVRVYSLRHEHSAAFQRLLHQPVGTAVPLRLEQRSLPLFLQGVPLRAVTAKLVLSPAPGQSLAGVTITVDGTPITGFAADETLGGLPSADLAAALVPNFLREHALAVTAAGGLAPTDPVAGDVSAIDADKLEDVFIHVSYRHA